jgi:hypothetical protein
MFALHFCFREKHGLLPLWLAVQPPSRPFLSTPRAACRSLGGAGQKSGGDGGGGGVGGAMLGFGWACLAVLGFWARMLAKAVPYPRRAKRPKPGYLRLRPNWVAEYVP